MGTKLPVTTTTRRLLLRALAITAMLVTASAITASAAAARRGVWRVRPSQTLNLTNMTIIAGDLDIAYIYVNGSQYDTLGNNSGFQNAVASLSDYPYSNTSARGQTVTVAIQDTTALGGVGCSEPFFSNGPNATATRTAFSINDGASFCTSGLVPTLGQGNFNGSVSIS